MKIQEIMERAGLNQTGIALTYIKEALEEINSISETHVKKSEINLEADKRFYDIPNEAIRIKDVRVKNQLNSKDEFRSIPRLVHEPVHKDVDGK